jgi:hypothetical protein
MRFFQAPQIFPRFKVFFDDQILCPWFLSALNARG